MIKKFLKYFSRIITYTLLTILIIFGLSLLFVFVTSKVAKSRDQEPPINLFTIISPSMTPSINVYDVVVSIKTKPSKIKIGDVISFYSDNPNVNGMTITHRVIQVYQDYETFSFRTKGDFNKDMDSEFVNQDKIVGKVYFKIPQLGRVQFFLGSKGGWLIAILIPALAIISYDIYKIIKLIIVKQKILSYKNKGDDLKIEIETNPILTDFAPDISRTDENQEIQKPLELSESSLTEENKAAALTEIPIVEPSKRFDEPQQISEVSQLSVSEGQLNNSEQSEQFKESLIYNDEKPNREIINEEVLESGKLEQEKPEEILIISD